MDIQKSTQLDEFSQTEHTFITQHPRDFLHAPLHITLHHYREPTALTSNNTVNC